MQFRFMHIADVHLGYLQYGLVERGDDFSAAFNWAIDEAIRHRVDFVLLAGDLFHKRAIDALTLNQAMAALRKLKDAGIPCIAVEGNHEIAYYEEKLGWLQFLAVQQLIILLAPAILDGKISLSAYVRRRGSWHDPVPGVRVHGLRFMGGATRDAITRYAAALADHDRSGVGFSIFMAHTGVQGVLDGDLSSPTHAAWEVMKGHADYIALGHIHKPFDFDDWIFNPGSLESNSIAEYEWGERGCLLVTVETAGVERESGKAPFSVERVSSPKRPFRRIFVKVDHCASQTELLHHAQNLFDRELTDQPLKKGDPAPIVELFLTGNLPFDASALELRELTAAALEAFKALHVQVKNGTSRLDLRATAVEEGLSRTELEQHALTNLFSADTRFAAQAAEWADATIQVKNLAIAKAPPAAIVEELQSAIERLD